MTKSALILAGKAIQDHEYIYPYYRLQGAGYSVRVAVRGGGTVQGAIGVQINATDDIPTPSQLGNGAFSDGWLKDCKLLVLPGGAKAMEYMRQDKDVLNTIQQFYNNGRIIASICHAGQLLISARLVYGKRIAAYYSIRDDIVNAGGIYVEDTDEPVVTCDRIVSSAHYKHLGPWMEAVLMSVAMNELDKVSPSSV